MTIPQALSVFTGETNLQYHLYDGDGPTIVFIHANGFNPWLWYPIARELAGRYRIVAPFFCDHRDTDPEKGGLAWTILAHDLISLCGHLNIIDPFMVGHSMGGGVCVLAHGLVADLARKMVLIEPIVLPEYYYQGNLSVDKHPLARQAIRRKNTWKDYAEAESYLRSKPLFHNWDPEMLQLYMSHGMSSGDGGELELTCSPNGEAALFMGSLAQSPWPLLPEITCPVLILEGDKSESHNYLDLPAVTRMLPRGEYRGIPDAGHLMVMENPGQIRRLIHDFFSQDT